MTCLNCQAVTPDVQLLVRPIEGGRAYAHMCSTCGRVVSVRPRTEADPPIIPSDLSQREVDRLRFVQWRLSAEAREQLLSSPDNWPQTAA